MDPRQLVEAFYAELWNRHDAGRIPALLHEDFLFRGSLGEEHRGHAGFAGYVDRVHAALGDYRCEILDLVVEDRRAFARMHFAGVHRGELLGHPATGRPVSWVGAALFRCRGDRIAELWVLGDLLGRTGQLS